MAIVPGLGAEDPERVRPRLRSHGIRFLDFSPLAVRRHVGAYGMRPLPR
jgi:hypothetical protein